MVGSRRTLLIAFAGLTAAAVAAPGFGGDASTIQLVETRAAAPNFVGISKWFNSAPLSISDLRGKVVLVDFWTYGCYNCVNTLPYVTKLYDTYRRRHPYPGISVRTVGRQCAGRAEAAWHHLSGGAGQRLGDLERLAQSILRRPNTSLTSTVPLLA